MSLISTIKRFTSSKLAAATVLISVVMLQACSDQIPGFGGSAPLVVDLNAVAKATGQDQAMAQQLQVATNTLNSQLSDIAIQLQQKVDEEKEKLAEDKDKDQKVQQLNQTANRQLQQTQAVAQQRAKQFETGLVVRFRQQVKSVAETVAKSKGAKMVVLSDASLVWFDESVDITDEVIAAIRANPDLMESSQQEAANSEEAGQEAPAPE